MDDFVLSNLQESKNEWCSRLVSIFTPLVVEGIKSVFDESWKMCLDNDEPSKYLMTFQNLLSRIPKWNLVTVEEERKRIVERSGCNYLEDLISCVHIIQLKVLTCIRVGSKQKLIDISIPKLDNFIHKVYIHVARKLYQNIYLFEKQISPLQIQKNGRECEIIVQECIMTTIRESIPTEDIIRAYMDESVEHEEVITIEQLKDPVLVDENIPDDSILKREVSDDKIVIGVKDKDDKEVTTQLKFNDIDSVLDETNSIGQVNAPKSLERLEEISVLNAIKRKQDEEEEEEEENGEQVKIKIHSDNPSDNIDLGQLDFLDYPDNSKDIILDVEEFN
jgi:hypothetical protein